jgi:hypothetical protein
MSSEPPKQDAPTDGTQTPGGTQMVKKKFLNGWTPELEDLMADWADKAACYRWMHEKTSKLYQGRDRSLNIPVIILSGVTAGANFALGSIFDPDDITNKKWAQLGLGGASLITGIIQTLMNFYGYAKGAEANRVAGISWGKFNRQLCIEMRVHPDERMDSTNFLKMFRIELDRLIEQSPVIPDNVISVFNKLFKTVEVVKPEITGILEHTQVYKDTGARLKRIAAEATIAIHYRRGILKQLVVDDLETKTRNTAIEEARKVAQEIFEKQKAQLVEEATKSLKTSAAAPRLTPAKAPTFVEIAKAERQNEIQALAKENSGSVAALRDRFRDVIKPIGSGTEKNVSINTIITVRDHETTQPVDHPSESVSIHMTPGDDSNTFHTPIGEPADETDANEKV